MKKLLVLVLAMMLLVGCSQQRKDTTFMVTRDNTLYALYNQNGERQMCIRDRDKVVTIYDGLKKQGKHVKCAEGYPMMDDDSLFESFGYGKKETNLTGNKDEKIQERCV